MKYRKAIMDHFEEIVAQAQGQQSEDAWGTESYIALFPNYPLASTYGDPFNVCGVLQVTFEDKTHGLYFLCLDKNPEIIKRMMNFENTEAIFAVAPNGRVKKQDEKVIIAVFNRLARRWKEKYKATPGYIMCLSEDQIC